MGIALVIDGEGTGQSLDAGRVAERLMLAAHARGVGAATLGQLGPAPTSAVDER